jgi:hypothetical protein
MAATSVLFKPLFRPLEESIEQAFQSLADPEKSVAAELEKGQAAGKLNVIYSLFPPEGVDRPLAYFTFVETAASFPHEKRGISVPLMIRRFENGSDSGADSVLLGMIDARYLRRRGIACSSEQRWAVVRYNLSRREGHIFLSKEVHARLTRFRS